MKNIILTILMWTLSFSAGQVLASVKGEVRIDGSSTVFPISEAVAEEFGRAHKGVRVTVGKSGTGGGFKKFILGEIDINDASRKIKDKEKARAQVKGIEFAEIPVAFDGITIVVNKSNKWVDYLTVAELNKLWKPGSTVKTWKDIRPEWPAEKIIMYSPGADSGTFDFFTEVINGKSQASRSDMTMSEDDNVLVQGVVGDKNAIGYFGFAYYVENKTKIRSVPVKLGTADPVAPTLETIRTGKYKPLSRPMFIYVSKQAAVRPIIQEFVKFYMTEAPALATEVGYVPMPQAQYVKGQKTFEKLLK